MEEEYVAQYCGGNNSVYVPNPNGILSNSGLRSKRNAPKERREPIFVTLSLWVECSRNGSHSILAPRPQI